MKTITLKADNAFDTTLSELAQRQHSTKSAIIRVAVERYREWLEQEELRQKICDASLKTRKQHTELMRSMDQANSDGL